MTMKEPQAMSGQGKANGAGTEPGTGIGMGTSVLLPVFMRGASVTEVALLDRAIASVLEQDYPGPLEILVIDDGSPMPVADLVRSGHLPHRPEIRWERNERNSGLVHTLNRGLALASHPYIARMDGDDRWCPGKIARQFERLHADPDLTIVATGMTIVDAEGRTLDTHLRKDGWGEIMRFSLEVGCPFPHGSVVARRDVYRLLGGYPHDPAFSHCEDYTLWSLWLRFFKPAMVEELLFDYTASSGSVSGLHSAQQRRASGAVNLRLRRQNLQGTLPADMERLATLLGLSVFEAGVACYRLWRYRPMARLPAAALPVLRRILVDRDLEAIGDDHTEAVGLDRLLAGFRSAPPFPPDQTVAVAVHP